MTRYHCKWIGLENRTVAGIMYTAAGWYIFDRDLQGLCLCLCRNRSIAIKLCNALSKADGPA